MEMATQITSAYAARNDLAMDDLPALAPAVYAQLKTALRSHKKERRENLVPAVSIDESLGDDYIICLEDGQKYKSLKRHLRTKYDMTPKAYREKWGLPADYPMVAPNYSKERSRLAKRTGLGKS